MKPSIFRLRLIIPAMLFPLTLILVGGLTVAWLRHARTDVLESGREDLMVMMRQLREDLSTELAWHDLAVARRRIATFARNHDIAVLALIDENRGILLANRHEWHGAPLSVLPRYDRGTAATVCGSGECRVVAVPETMSLFGYFPVVIPARPGELPPRRTAPLYVEYSLSRHYGHARHHAYLNGAILCASSLFMTLSLWVVLHLLITRRVERLTKVAGAIADGNLTVRSEISGRDEIAGLSAAFCEVTERLVTEGKELRRAKNHLTKVINSMPSILVCMDEQDTVTQWNPEAENATGIPAREALGKQLREVPFVFRPWIETLRPQMAKRRPVAMERLLLEDNGQQRFYDLMLYPLLADSGVEGVVVRIEDVTERTRVQQLMIQAEKMQSVGGLAAGMAHEINNPLGIISQATQNIERRLSRELPANRQAAAEVGLSLESLDAYLARRKIGEFIANIRESVDRAAKIVADTLRFSRPGASGMEPVSLALLMDRAVDLAENDYDLKKKYDFRSIEIVREYGTLPDVPVVAAEIEQVVLNLLKNAAQAMATAAPRGKPRITLRLRQEGGYAVLEVEDNGPGMEENVRRRVFEPFFTTKEPGVGTGLGLSVSYMIVTGNHRGFIEAIAAPGGGARFVVWLPLAAGRDPGQPQTPGDGAGEKP